MCKPKEKKIMKWEKNGQIYKEEVKGEKGKFSYSLFTRTKYGRIK